MHDIQAWLAADHGVLVGRRHPSRRSTLQRHVRRGALITVLPGVHVSPAGLDDPLTMARALSALHPDAVVCGDAAARLTFWPQRIVGHIDIAGVRLPGAHPRYLLSRRHVPPELILSIDGIRATCPDLTALDLAAETDGASIDQVLRTRSGSLPGMAIALNAVPGRRGDRARRRLLLDSRDEPWSAAERLAHRIFRAAGITGWRANHRVLIRGRTYYLDMAFPGLRLAIEIDGREWHSSAAAFENDRSRHNELTAAGWIVLHLTWDMLDRHPEEVIRIVRSALRRAAR